MAKWDELDDMYSDTPLAERQAFQVSMASIEAEVEARRHRDKRLRAEIDELMAEYEQVEQAAEAV